MKGAPIKTKVRKEDKNVGDVALQKILLLPLASYETYLTFHGLYYHGESIAQKIILKIITNISKEHMHLVL